MSQDKCHASAASQDSARATMKFARAVVRLVVATSVYAGRGANARQLHHGKSACTEFNIGDGAQITEGIPEPGWSTAQLDEWWTKMKACRAWQLESIKYNGSAFKNHDLDWTQGAFAIPMVQGYDRFLYDENTNTYTVDRLVDDLVARYGGADAVFLWPTYTNIGMDNRNQARVPPPAVCNPDYCPRWCSPRLGVNHSCAPRLSTCTPPRRDQVITSSASSTTVFQLASRLYPTD